MKQFIALFLLLGSLLCTPVTSFALGDELYRIDMPIRSRSVTDRNLAMRQSLEKVFIRVTGNKEIAALPLIKEQLAHPKNLLQEYNYIVHKQSASNPQFDDAPVLSIHFKFEKRAIKALLAQAEQTIWPNVRPSLIAWLSIDRGNGPQLITSEEDQESTHFLDSAQGRGIAATLPVFDITDLQLVEAYTIANRLIQPITKASQRYDAKAIVIGNLKKLNSEKDFAEKTERDMSSDIKNSAEDNSANAPTWQLTLELLLEKENSHWKFTGNDPQALLNQGVDAITQVLLSKFTHVPNPTNQTSAFLTIDNVNNAEQYNLLNHYLSHLAPVTHLQILYVKPNELIYQINFHGSLQNLMQAITLNHVLAPAAMTAVDSQGQLHYRLAL